MPLVSRKVHTMRGQHIQEEHFVPCRPLDPKLLELCLHRLVLQSVGTASLPLFTPRNQDYTLRLWRAIARTLKYSCRTLGDAGLRSISVLIINARSQVVLYVVVCIFLSSRLGVACPRFFSFAIFRNSQSHFRLRRWLNGLTHSRAALLEEIQMLSPDAYQARH